MTTANIGSFDYFGDLINSQVNKEEEEDESNTSFDSNISNSQFTEVVTKVCGPPIKQTHLTLSDKVEEEVGLHVPMSSSNAKKEPKKQSQKKKANTKEETLPIEDTSKTPTKTTKATSRKKIKDLAAAAAATLSSTENPSEIVTTGDNKRSRRSQPKTTYITKKELQPIFNLICKLIE